MPSLDNVTKKQKARIPLPLIKFVGFETNHVHVFCRLGWFPRLVKRIGTTTLISPNTIYYYYKNIHVKYLHDGHVLSEDNKTKETSAQCFASHN